MKTVKCYQCEYCNWITHDERLMEYHESICEHNPSNSENDWVEMKRVRAEEER